MKGIVKTVMGSEDNKKIGTWFWDAEGLPAFRYEGRLPYEEKYDDGRKIELPDDQRNLYR